MRGLVYDIMHFAIHDGPGIRTTVFLKGCPMRCLWCHNPESQSAEPEYITRERTLENKKYREKEKVGEHMTVDEVTKEILKDRVFMEESGGGVTFSGGEPLMQGEFLLEMLKKCKKEGIHTAIDTCGYGDEQLVESIIPFTDLFLYDLKLMEDERHIEYTGTSNATVMNNLERILRAKKDVTIRFPVIPGLTDNEKNLEEMIAFLKNHPQLKKIDLLPYHSLAKSKYQRTNRSYALEDLPEPTRARMKELKKLFAAAGMEVNSTSMK